MYHNQNITISPKDKATFRNGACQKKMLRPPTRLIRFITPGENYLLGGFWISLESLNKIQSFMENNSATLQEVARSWMAVKEEWNESMDHILCIELTNPVYGWVGSIRTQTKTNHDNVHFMGNLEQVFLPGLHEVKKPQECFKMISFIHVENY